MLIGRVSAPPALAVACVDSPLYGTSADFQDAPEPFKEGTFGSAWEWLWSC